jgi:hypothetical protein
MADSGPPFDDDDLINDFNEEDDYFAEEFEDPYMDEPDAGQTNDHGNAPPAPHGIALATSEEKKEQHYSLQHEEDNRDSAISVNGIPDQVIVSSVPIIETKLYSFDRYVNKYVDMDLELRSYSCLFLLTYLTMKGILAI